MIAQFSALYVGLHAALVIASPSSKHAATSTLRISFDGTAHILHEIASHVARAAGLLLQSVRDSNAAVLTQTTNLSLAIAISCSLAWASSSVYAEPAVDDHAAAKAHFLAGQRHFDLSEYDAAIAEYKEAYNFDTSPVFLFNIAQSYRLQAEVTPTHDGCLAGLLFYKKFLVKKPDATNREQIGAWIALMQTCVDKLSAPLGGAKDAPSAATKTIAVAPSPSPLPQLPRAIIAQPPTVRPPSETRPLAPVPSLAATSEKIPASAVATPPRSHDKKHGSELSQVGGLLVGSVGILLAAGGSYFAVHASNLAGPVESSCTVRCMWTSADQVTADDVRNANSTARLLFETGGAAIVVGTALYIWGHVAHADHEVQSLAVIPTEGGAMMTTSGHF